MASHDWKALIPTPIRIYFFVLEPEGCCGVKAADISV
jgi:hypothetical protein